MLLGATTGTVELVVMLVMLVIVMTALIVLATTVRVVTSVMITFMLMMSLEAQTTARLLRSATRQTSSIVLCLPIHTSFFSDFEYFVNKTIDLEIPDDVCFSTVDDVQILADDAHEGNNHLFGWMCEAWISLHKSGVRRTIPPDPQLLLTGWYDRLAERKGAIHDFKIQRYITQELDDLSGERYQKRKSLTPVDSARHLSNSFGGSVAWSRAIPKLESLRLYPQEYRLAHLIRQGICPFTPLGLKTCCCGQPLTLTHALWCKQSRMRFVRHDTLVDDLFTWLKAHNVLVRKEIMVLPNSSVRIDLWIRLMGKIFWLDVMVTEPTCATYLAQSATKPGYALKVGEKMKFKHWNPVVEESVEKATIIPAVFETSGRMGAKLVNFLKRIAGKSGDGPSVGEIKLQLAVTLQRYNAAMVLEAIRNARGHVLHRRMRWRR